MATDVTNLFNWDNPTWYQVPWGSSFFWILVYDCNYSPSSSETITWSKSITIKYPSTSGNAYATRLNNITSFYTGTESNSKYTITNTVSGATFTLRIAGTNSTSGNYVFSQSGSYSPTITTARLYYQILARFTNGVYIRPSQSWFVDSTNVRSSASDSYKGYAIFGDHTETFSYSYTYFTNLSNDCADIIGTSRIYDADDPNGGGGNSSGGGGGGGGNIGGTPHATGSLPSISAMDSGLLTLYNPSIAQLQSLGQFLWSDQFSLDNFKKLFNDPFDTLLGLSIVPVSPTVSGAHNILFGNLDTGINCSVVANQFVQVDCGTLTLNEVWNGALDYAPSTQVSIYLPFIGTRQLNTNDVMGSVLHLYYRFDVLTGSCVAEITINHSAQGNKSSGFSYNPDMGSVYTFVGQCGVNIPLASQDYTNTIRAAIGAVGMAAGVGASVATGNPAIGVASVLTQSANIGMQANTPTVERSGHLSGSGALLSSYEPCLFVTRPHQCKPQKYYALRGIPSQVYVSALNKATGFFQIADVQNIHCSGATDSELTEIKTKLTQGVFVTTWPSDLSGSSTLDVQLYNNTSAVNRIDKSLTGIRSGDNALDGTFRDSVNIDRPTIRIRINDISDLKHANYMYIAMFERYYFIDSITSVRNNIVEIQGHIDVLKTYGYQIGQNTAILSRSSQAGSSGYGNTYLDDNLLATYQDTYNVSYPWGYTFSHDNDSLILAVAGASVSSE